MNAKLPKRKLNRLKEYDYSLNNYYFVTICTKDRTKILSNILNEKPVLSRAGKIVERVLTDLSNFYPCELDAFVIMPDHLHVIIILDNNNEEDKKCLSAIIQRFKTFTSKKINEILDTDDKFYWQKSFYDRIIRNEKELYLIRNYIKQNPKKWELDKDLPENLNL